MTGTRLDLLDDDVVAAARAVLGCRLTTTVNGQETTVIVNEVEAYGGADDPASHAHSGRTPRNGSMFQRAGTLYVYRIYGIHWCANIVAGPSDEPAAILIRGGVPFTGRDSMMRRRGRDDHLCDGPGKLCEALGITGDMDGTSLDDGPVRLTFAGRAEPTRVEATTRIGITRAKDRPWRFVARFAFGSSLADT